MIDVFSFVRNGLDKDIKLLHEISPSVAGSLDIGIVSDKRRQS